MIASLPSQQTYPGFNTTTRRSTHRRQLARCEAPEHLVAVEGGLSMQHNWEAGRRTVGTHGAERRPVAGTVLSGGGSTTCWGEAERWPGAYSTLIPGGGVL